MDRPVDLIINEIFQVLVSNNVSFAEAQEILNSLKNKLYASAKLK